MSRKGVRMSYEKKLLAKEAWRTKAAREREASQLVAHLRRVARINAAKHKRLRKRMAEASQAKEIKDKWGRRYAGMAPAYERDEDHVAHKNYLSTDAFVLDVDVIGQDNDAYKEYGWTRAVSDLDAVLRRRGERILQVATGVHHTIILSSEGQCYSFGWNDMG